MTKQEIITEINKLMELDADFKRPLKEWQEQVEKWNGLESLDYGDLVRLVNHFRSVTKGVVEKREIMGDKFSVMYVQEFTFGRKSYFEISDYCGQAYINCPEGYVKIFNWESEELKNFMSYVKKVS